MQALPAKQIVQSSYASPKLQILGGVGKKFFGANAPHIVPPNFRDKSPPLTTLHKNKRNCQNETKED
jgi:hypothetical protein